MTIGSVISSGQAPSPLPAMALMGVTIQLIQYTSGWTQHLKPSVDLSNMQYSANDLLARITLCTTRHQSVHIYIYQFHYTTVSPTIPKIANACKVYWICVASCAQMKSEILSLPQLPYHDFIILPPTVRT